MSQFAEVSVRYDAPAVAEQSDDTFRLRLPTDGVRAGSRLVAELARPGVARDALLTLGEILHSDLRRKPNDRADYLQYLLAQGKRATKELWEAQKSFLDEKYGAAETDEGPLDPIVKVDDSGLSIEVFSADESSYARLHFKSGEAFSASDLSPGVTHLDLSPALLTSLAQMRSYRSATLELSRSEGGEARDVKVPYRWIRALSQVQAASTLPGHEFEIAPVDLYNILLTLRMQKAKTSPRALRYELVPGSQPRIVLEPWDRVIESTGPTYEGSAPGVVRTWGRRRLSALSRLLPHVVSIKVRLVGAGLPAFYVLDLGDATLTVALSGWTDSGWAGISTFDLQVDGADDVFAQRVLTLLATRPLRLEELAEETSRERGTVRHAILSLMQRGLVFHDLTTSRFVHRPLFVAPLDVDALRFRDEHEAQAHQLLAVPGQVRLTKVHDLGGEGTRIEGEVEDRAAHRNYATSFTIDREGRTVDASCTSPHFRRSGLREGPSAPMIALRLLYAKQRAELMRMRDTPEGRALIRAETRTLIRREAEGSTTYRVSLDERTITVRWGRRPDEMRMSRAFFGTEDEAREDYFARLERCARKGFIDASAAEMV